jgi:nitrate/nitrite-specific signal transduction histidine kinase
MQLGITRPISNRELLSRVRSMLRIKKAEDELQRAHDELEQRVKERTSELEMANKELVQEIVERTRAEESLKKALTEIEGLKNRLEMENRRNQVPVRAHHKRRIHVQSPHSLTGAVASNGVSHIPCEHAENPG